MSRPVQRLLALPLITLLVLLAGCELAPGLLDSNSPTWTPEQFPQMHDDAFLPPFGPHDVHMSVDSAETVTDVTGYLDLSPDGACSAHLVAEERRADGGAVKSFEVVKIGHGPAYASLNNQGWGDMRDPATPTLDTLTVSHPLGGALNAENRYQSLCFIHALSAMLTPGGQEEEFLWDEESLEQFADASYDSFVSLVLKEASTSQEEYVRLAQTVSELGSRPTLAFASGATPLKVAESSTGAIVLTFAVMQGQEHRVTIVLTPSQARKLEYPKNSKPFEEYLGKSRQSEGGVRGLIGQYFSVR